MDPLSLGFLYAVTLGHITERLSPITKSQNNKIKSQELYERVIKFREGIYDSDKKLTMTDKTNVDVNNINKNDCIFYPAQYTIPNLELGKANRIIEKVGRNVVVRLIPYSSAQKNKLNGAHNIKWHPMYLTINGAIKYSYGFSKNNIVDNNGNISVFFNPRSPKVSFINDYTINDDSLSNTLKSKSQKAMLFAIPTELLHIMSLYNSKLSSCDGNEEVDFEDLTKECLVPYHIVTNKIEYYHNDKQQIKALVIHSSDLERKSSSGTVTIYFTKNRAKHEAFFAEVINDITTSQITQNLQESNGKRLKPKKDKTTRQQARNIFDI